jgi:hypothetical protein
MAINAQKYLPLGFGLLFAISAILSLFVMFKAGCAGGPKGGSRGDPAHSLQTQGIGLLPLLLSAASGGSSIGMLSKSIQRLAHGLDIAIFTLFFPWLTGIQFNIWGAQSCFMPSNTAVNTDAA